MAISRPAFTATRVQHAPVRVLGRRPARSMRTVIIRAEATSGNVKPQAGKLEHPLTDTRIPEEELFVEHAKDFYTIAENFDIARSCVKPVYRTMETVEATKVAETARTAARICLMGESNICRSLLAEAILDQLLVENGLQDMVKVESRASQDYCEGEGPHELVELVAESQGLSLPVKEGGAKEFDDSTDIERFEMVLAMDRYCLMDVLRETSVYDTINPHSDYCNRFRLIGEFVKVAADGKPVDIDDPLYGNYSTEQEKEKMHTAVWETANQIRTGCEALLKMLLELKNSSQQSDKSMRELLAEHVREMKATEWLKPPMLTGR